MLKQDDSARRTRRGARLAAWAVAIALASPTAEARLPREVGRAFLQAGIPLNHVGIVVQAAKNGIIERGDNVTTRL